MTTAALLQATSIVADTVVAGAATMTGTPGGYFDATPTNTIVSILNAPGVGAANWVSEFRAQPSVVLNAPGACVVSFAGQTIVTVVTPAMLTASGVGALNGFSTVSSGFRPAALTAPGSCSVSFKDGSSYPTPPPVTKPLRVRYIAGPESGVIPVEIVSAPGPDVIEVQLMEDHTNYTPIFVDPTNPMRKKIHFVD